MSLASTSLSTGVEQLPSTGLHDCGPGSGESLPQGQTEMPWQQVSLISRGRWVVVRDRDRASTLSDQGPFPVQSQN